MLAGMGEAFYWLGRVPGGDRGARAGGRARQPATTTTGRSRSRCGSSATSRSTSPPTSIAPRSCSTARSRPRSGSATRARSPAPCCSRAGCRGRAIGSRTPRRSGDARSTIAEATDDRWALVRSLVLAVDRDRRPGAARRGHGDDRARPRGRDRHGRPVQPRGRHRAGGPAARGAPRLREVAARTSTAASRSSPSSALDGSWATRSPSAASPSASSAGSTRPSATCDGRSRSARSSANASSPGGPGGRSPTCRSAGATTTSAEEHRRRAEQEESRRPR